MFTDTDATVIAQNLKQFKIALRVTDLSYAISGKLYVLCVYILSYSVTPYILTTTFLLRFVLLSFILCWPRLSFEALHLPFSSGIVFIWCILFSLVKAVD